MIALDNHTNLNINLKDLENIAKQLTAQEIELLVVDDAYIQSLNKQYRDKDKSTDVLSFPLDNPFDLEDMPLGSIVIASSFVIGKAQEFGHTQEEECALLFIHGLLHLLGFDHECDNGEMRSKEKEIIESFDLPQSLIVRTV